MPKTQPSVAQAPKPAPYRPKVAIVDDFQDVYIDIDGDHVPDLTHGELVQRFLLSQCPNADVSRYDISPDPNHFREGEQSSLEYHKNIRLAFQQLPPGQFDSVNLSVATPVQAPSNKLDTQTMLQRFRVSEQESYRLGAKTIKAMEALIHAGTQIFVAAGNDGPTKANLYGLADGVVNVGATSADPQVVTCYSHRHAQVHAYPQGTFAVTKVQGGYDLTGDNKPEVLDSEVSGGTPFIFSFVGKTLADLEAKPMDIRDLWQQRHSGYEKNDIFLLQHRLFPLDLLRKTGLMDDNEYRFFSTLGTHAVLNPRPYMSISRWEIFKADTDGNICYAPDGSGRPGAINKIEGTSFSTPLENGRWLNEQYHRRLDKTA